MEEQFGFEEALKRIKEGKKVKRAHWGGYWFYTSHIYMEHQSDWMNPMIVAYTKADKYVPATPYQEDLLAEDWSEVE